MKNPESNLPSPPHGVRELAERLRQRALALRTTRPARKPWLYDADLDDQAADALTAQDQRLAELTKERDEANENLNEALVWQDVALDRQRRAEAAEARSTRAEGLLGVLAKAAKRACMDHFGGAMGSFSLGRSMMLLQREALAAAALLSSISGGEGEGFRQTPEQPQCADEGTLPSLAPGAGVSGAEHAPDCQSHIVDVRGIPDDCTCGVSGAGGDR